MRVMGDRVVRVCGEGLRRRGTLSEHAGSGLEIEVEIKKSQLLSSTTRVCRWLGM